MNKNCVLSEHFKKNKKVKDVCMPCNFESSGKKLRIKAVVFQMFIFIIGWLLGAKKIYEIMEKKLYKKNIESDKNSQLYLMMNEWVRLKQDGKNLGDYFTEKGYKTIAIYGMNYVGKTLLRELEKGDVKVLYAVDQNVNLGECGLPLYLPDAELPAVDALVITPISFYAEIKENMEKKSQCAIISIEDVVYESSEDYGWTW